MQIFIQAHTKYLIWVFALLAGVSLTAQTANSAVPAYMREFAERLGIQNPMDLYAPVECFKGESKIGLSERFDAIKDVYSDHQYFKVTTLTQNGKEYLIIGRRFVLETRIIVVELYLIVDDTGKVGVGAMQKYFER